MTLKLLFLTLCFLLLNCQANAQTDWASPCPGVLVYEGGSKEPNRWYGIVTLLSDSDLSGVWVRIGLNKQARSIGNWLGEVSTKDLKSFLIVNRNHILKANVPDNVRFYVDYDPRESPPPKVVLIRLNAQTICPVPAATDSSTTQPELHLSTYSPFARGGSSSTTTKQQAIINITPPPRKTEDTNDVCGTVIAQPRPLIRNGQETAVGEFPWHAALYHSQGPSQKYVCGGSLISKVYVITAAHCVTKSRSQRPIDPNNLFVFLGKYLLRRFTNVGLQDREVSDVIVHPEFTVGTGKNDVALLKLAGEADITDYVRPVCLWQDSPNINTVLDKQGSVAGWGYDETGHLSEELMQAKMPVVSDITCVRSYPEFYSRFTSDYSYCAGFRNGTTVCSGDSGGGMVFPKAESNGRSTKWQLRGIISISVAFESGSCDTSNYVVFMDAAKYLDWIKKSII